MNRSSLPSDPLAALGPAVFLSICEYLSYLPLGRLPSVSKSWRDFSKVNQSAIWRSASYRFSVDHEKIVELRELERNAHAASEEGEVDGPPVDWKEVCMERVMPHVNWARGDFENFFPFRERHSEVQQFTVDEEDGTCLISRDYGDISVIDIETGDALFLMPRVCPHIEMEFCHGFMAIASSDGGFRYRIFRTRNAIARSSRPWAVAAALVSECRGSRLLADPDWRPESVLRPDNDDAARAGPAAIGRGCLAYYRDIMMPTYTQAHRMKRLGGGTDGDRVSFGIVGKAQIYVWDVEDPDELPVVYDIPKGLAGISLIDFDEDFIYLSASEHIHIISRSTGKSVLSFPPNPVMNHTICAIIYEMDPIPGEDEIPDFIDLTEPVDEPPVDHTLNHSTSEPLRSQGHMRGTTGYKSAMNVLRGCLKTSRLETRQWLWQHRDREAAQTFPACHRSGNDLIYAHRDGFLFITRNFPSILTIRNSKDRVRKWGQQTIVLRLAHCVLSLSIRDKRVAVGTLRNVIFFDTDTLPPISDSPARQAIAPVIRTRTVARVKTNIAEIMGDPHICSTEMYVSYYAHDGSDDGRYIRGLDFGAGINQAQRAGGEEGEP